MDNVDIQILQKLSEVAQSEPSSIWFGTIAVIYIAIREILPAWFVRKVKTQVEQKQNQHQNDFPEDIRYTIFRIDQCIRDLHHDKFERHRITPIDEKTFIDELDKLRTMIRAMVKGSENG